MFSLTFYSTLLKASKSSFSETGLIVKREISVATGRRAQMMTLRLCFNASVATTPLPAKGSHTISPSLEYVLINSPTTFQVFLDQNLCQLYMGVWAWGGICLFR